MDRIRKMFYLILVILNFNCHRAEYSYAVSLYVNNQIALANVVEQMVKKKNFTRISIRKKTFFEKLFTIDFIDKAFVDIIKTNQNYDIISIEYLISSNNVDNITLKTPELTYLTLMIGFETGIEYRNTGSLDFNVINSKQIEGDWYFVEY